MRLLVCGGRAYRDLGTLSAALQSKLALHPDLMIICGYDPDDERFQGADQLAYEWAIWNDVPVFPFRAPWEKLGRRAGPCRNQRMLIRGKPQAVMAFPGGRGTDDMCKRAAAAGLQPERVIEAYAF